MACLEQFPEAAFLEFIKPSDVFLESEKFVSLNTTWRSVQILFLVSADTPGLIIPIIQ